ncbi:basic salivary proline-rich protein 2-like [Dryobates pubescens]|uniref:basic salivary proline-rich protein 2-like n=1 Tax=Dryobates pubescens TaxID=118200 RepID=UPI0023B9BDE9|nr:basic salivary proline-rich protein 2-like [Dryobates pubescens]
MVLINEMQVSFESLISPELSFMKIEFPESHEISLAPGLSQPPPPGDSWPFPFTAARPGPPQLGPAKPQEEPEPWAGPAGQQGEHDPEPGVGAGRAAAPAASSRRRSREGDNSVPEAARKAQRRNRGCGERGLRRLQPPLSRGAQSLRRQLRGCGSSQAPAPTRLWHPPPLGAGEQEAALGRRGRVPTLPPPALPPPPRPAQSGRRRHGPPREQQALASDACATPSRCCRGLDSARSAGEEAADDRRAAAGTPLCHSSDRMVLTAVVKNWKTG